MEAGNAKRRIAAQLAVGDETERDIIVAALTRAGGSPRRAARELGYAFHSGLWRRIRDLGLGEEVVRIRREARATFVD